MSATKLTIKGLVNQTVEVTADELESMGGQIPDVSSLVPGRDGTAVKLSALLDRTQPSERADYATLESSDGRFKASVPLEGIREGLVLYRLNEEPLPEKYGGPFRFLIPNAAACETAEVDACANVKFLASIELTEGPGEDTRAKDGRE